MKESMFPGSKSEVPLNKQVPEEETPEKSGPETYVTSPEGFLVKADDQKTRDALAESWREK